ncbi:MAG: WxPxxD family membrane protein [Oscillospiraceae bacterium]|nr:WxPxxD family membrane protein [Candidatus Limimonas egerieequi]
MMTCRIKTKLLIKLGVFWLLAFCVLWIALIFKDLISNSISDMTINLLEYNYSGVNYLIVVPIIPLLVSCYYFSNNYFPSRYETRDRLVFNELISNTIICFVIACIHELINAIGLIVINAKLSAKSLLFYGLINVITITIYYLRCTFIFSIFNNFFEKNISLLLTFLLYFVEAVIVKNYLLLNWMPCDDVSVYYDLLFKQNTYYQVGMVLLRNIFTSLAIFLLALILHRKKDFIDETK